MGTIDAKIGIIGGNGALGSAIARALLTEGALAPENLLVSCRSGTAPALEQWPEVGLLADNRALADAADVIVLSVPPAAFSDLEIRATDKPVISVMAGITADRIARQTGTARVIRAMSSPAAAAHLAFSVWFATPGATPADREIAENLLAACGPAAEVPDESQLDAFTALTGPVPGFVASFAEAMAGWAEAQGIDGETADRAVRQLFLASGIALAESEDTPEAHVRAMIDYAGTTAAGLESMKASPLDRAIHDGLDAARDRARAMGRD